MNKLEKEIVSKLLHDGVFQSEEKSKKYAHDIAETIRRKNLLGGFERGKLYRKIENLEWDIARLKCEIKKFKKCKGNLNEFLAKRVEFTIREKKYIEINELLVNDLQLLTNKIIKD